MKKDNNLLKLVGWVFWVSFFVLPAWVAAQDSKEGEEDVIYLKPEELIELDIEELMQVKIREVTIATGVKQTVAEAPAVTTVITAEDIEEMGATDLDEVLETVPGLHVVRSNIGYDPIYTIRGIHSKFNPEVLMLINGIPFKTLYLGDRNIVWGGMPVNAISRIEVIRGPGSAVYGADAFAGVINIITKSNDDINGTETGMRLGSFNTRDAWVLHGKNWGKLDVVLAIEYHDTDGQKEIIDVDYQTTLDNLFNTNASLAPGSVTLPRRNLDARLDFSYKNWRLRLGYQGRRDFGMGAGNAQALDPVARFAADRTNADITYHNKLSEDWDTTTQLSFVNMEFEPTAHNTLYPPGASLGEGIYPKGVIGDISTFEKHSRLDFSSFYFGFDEHVARIGMGYYYGDLYKTKFITNSGTDPTTGLPIPPNNKLVDVSDTPYVPIPENSRSNWYMFLQDTWHFASKWELTAGMRYDYYSDFGSTTNPRLALVWKVNPSLTTKLLYGHAFRAPAFSELYIINNPVILGNPNLKAETIRTGELSVNYQATNELYFALNLFSYKLRDKILYLPDINADTITAQNAGVQTGNGLETEVRWKIAKTFDIVGNYAFQKSNDDNKNHDVGNTPHHEVYLRAKWLVLPEWYLATQFNWVAERERVLGDPRSDIDDYTTVDLTLRYNKKSKKHWGFGMSIRNLFDTDAREPSEPPDSIGIIGIPNDLPLAGRNYFLEFSYYF